MRGHGVTRLRACPVWARCVGRPLGAWFDATQTLLVDDGGVPWI